MRQALPAQNFHLLLPVLYRAAQEMKNQRKKARAVLPAQAFVRGG
jgi:hypothetical protein